MAKSAASTDATAATATTKSAGRPLRADARRNRDQILCAAQTAFRERGADASLEEIARNAGVGIGTLYRHFPTRNLLLDAVFQDSIEVLCNEAEARCESLSPTDAFVGWLHAALEHAMTYQSLAAALMIADLDETAKQRGCGEQSACAVMRANAELQVTRAQEAGVIRCDVNVEDIVRLVNAIAITTEDAPDGDAAAERMFTLMVDGLRA
jgi:AcrR family transcriptional regulator